MDKNLALLSVVSIVAILAIVILSMNMNSVISGLASKNVDTAPDPVELVSPSDAATGQSLTPTFSWTMSHKADYVTVTIDDNPSFSTPVTFEHTLKKNAKSYMMPAGVLQSQTTYYWRVEAGNVAGATDSVTQTFTTS